MTRLNERESESLKSLIHSQLDALFNTFALQDREFDGLSC